MAQTQQQQAAQFAEYWADKGDKQRVIFSM